VTIDTNCINARGKHESVNVLEELHRRGLIELTSTFALAADLKLDKTSWGDARRAKAAGIRQGRSGFMVGRSTVGGPDVIGGPDIYVHVPTIMGAICPGKSWDAITQNSKHDVLHLATHRTYGWDVFVTDDKGILRAHESLATLGIVVCSPTAALRWLASRGVA
jgi:hypothetical protein